jgi:3-oxoacyl-[acyl-carrier-protein] synthase-1/3-oxoacyl-[acyl-carrier-protein] synthase II
MLDRTLAGAPHAALSLSSAFGGANAALVVGDERGRPRPVRPVFVRGVVHVDHEPGADALAAALAMSSARLARADSLVRLALAAVERLRSACGSLEGAGVVVGSALATLETNATFAAHVRARGPRAAEPRRFPYTSPNAVAGECSIAFRLTGPGFSVGGGLHAGLEAVVAGALLVGSGDADHVVVVAVDEAGPTTRALAGEAIVSGAVAVLLTASSETARARVGRWSLQRGPRSSGTLAAGHLALLPALGPSLPLSLACGSPPDAMATVTLDSV